MTDDYTTINETTSDDTAACHNCREDSFIEKAATWAGVALGIVYLVGLCGLTVMMIMMFISELEWRARPGHLIVMAAMALAMGILFIASILFVAADAQECEHEEQPSRQATTTPVSSGDDSSEAGDAVAVVEPMER